MNEHTHWRKILESEYLAGADLDDGNGKFKTITLTIARAGEEKVREMGTNKEEKCLVIHFKDNKKPMICNVTNAKAIEKATGTSYVEKWAGHSIKIGTEKVKAFGELWDALRVKPYKVEAAPPPAPAEQPDIILCKDCGQPIKEHMGAPARNIAAATFKKYGKVLCYDCSTQQKTATAAEPEPQKDEGDQLGFDEGELPFPMG
jgi:hypothetical protein